MIATISIPPRSFVLFEETYSPAVSRGGLKRICDVCVYFQAPNVLFCRDRAILFVWNLCLNDAPSNVCFPPLLVYILREDRFAVCSLKRWLWQTLLRGIVAALYPIQELLENDLWYCIDEDVREADPLVQWMILECMRLFVSF